MSQSPDALKAVLCNVRYYVDIFPSIVSYDGPERVHRATRASAHGNELQYSHSSHVDVVPDGFAIASDSMNS